MNGHAESHAAPHDAMPNGIAVPAALLPPPPAALAAAIAAVHGRTGLAAALACATEILAARAAAGDPWAAHLRLLLALVSAQLDTAPPLHDTPRIALHYDDQVAHYFEQLVALLRVQDTQIAELRAIIAELT